MTDRHGPGSDGGSAPSGAERRANDTQYTIRPFVPADREAVRELYATVTGRKPHPEWLTWKFGENPAATDVGIFVAETPAGVAGVRPLYPLRMRFGDEPVDVAGFVNAMIHPDYRGEGIFSALYRRATEYLSDRSDLLFCFANANSGPIYDHWGWTEVGRADAHFRFQSPGALVPGDGAWTRPARALLSSTAKGYLAVRDRLSTPPTDVSVTRTASVPSARLASLYRRGVPETLHVVRDERYYRWRLGGPEWSGAVYVATRHGTDVAAFVVQTRTVGASSTRVEISDALPLVPDRDGRRGFAALLDRVLGDHPNADVVALQDTRVPRELLRERGFVWSGRQPLSWLYERLFDPLTQFALPLSDVGFDVGDPDNWAVAELTRNTN